VKQEVFAEAEAALLAGNAVIGRAEGGGFYLLGLPFVEKSFFFGDNYGNDSVYQRTIEALRARVAVTELPPRGDIDDLSSLRARICLLRNTQTVLFRLSRIFRLYARRSVFLQRGINTTKLPKKMPAGRDDKLKTEYTKKAFIA
jgi:hypothetical protein